MSSWLHERVRARQISLLGDARSFMVDVYDGQGKQSGM